MTLFSWLFPQRLQRRRDRKRAKQAPVNVHWARKGERSTAERIGDRFKIDGIIILHNKNDKAREISKYLDRFGAAPKHVTKRKNYMILQIRRPRYKWAWYLLTTAGYEPSQDVPL